MNAEKFIKEATNPDSWLQKALSLRESADAVWELFGKKMSIDGYKNNTYSICQTSQFLYGLSAECLLKGLIVKQAPDSMIISASIDGNGDLIDAEIKKIGDKIRDTHNLEKLAEAAGLFKEKENATIRELLSYMSHCVKWRGRYPIPLQAQEDFTPRGKLHYKEFGHFFRDIADPFLDSLIKRF